MIPTIYRVFYGDDFYQYNNYKGDYCRFMVADGAVMFEEITKSQFDNDYEMAIEDGSLAK